MRFRCLCHHRTLHYSPKTAGNIIYACIILHNICRDRNVVLPYEEPELTFIENQDDYAVAVTGSQENENINPVVLSQGRRVRSQYINNYF